MNTEFYEILDFIEETYPEIRVYDYSVADPTSGQPYPILEVWAKVQDNGYGHDYDEIGAYIEDAFGGSVVAAINTYRDRIEMAFTLKGFW